MENRIENQNANFFYDKEKMIDFLSMTEDNFLASYSYLTDEEYRNTWAVYRDVYTKDHIAICPHCHRELNPSKVDGYMWECDDCDEDFCSFEVYTHYTLDGLKKVCDYLGYDFNLVDIDNDIPYKMFSHYWTCIICGMDLYDADRYAKLNHTFGYNIGLNNFHIMNEWLYKHDYDIFDFIGSVEEIKVIKECVSRCYLDIDYNNVDWNKLDDNNWFEDIVNNTSNKDTRLDMATFNVINIFEEFLDSKGIILENKDRELEIENGENAEELANIFGEDYYNLEENIKKVLDKYM